MQTKGGPSGAGIPVRNTISATLSPLGGSNLTSLTIASPGVATLASGAAPAAGTPFIFQSTIPGHLPTPLFPGTVYYVISPSGSAFQFAATVGGAAINTSGTQSGTQSILLDDTSQIQNAINSCPAGQVVLLNSGTFVVANNFLNIKGSSGVVSTSISNGMTLRGAGAGSTILWKASGVIQSLSIVASVDVTGVTMTVTSVAPGVNLIPGLTISLTNQPNALPSTAKISAWGTGTGGAGTYTLNTNVGQVPSQTMQAYQGLNNQTPIIIVGPGQFGPQPGPKDGSSNSTNLTADGVAGSNSITVANAAIFTGGAGQIVLLDERTNAQWMPERVLVNNSGTLVPSTHQIWASSDYRTVYKKRYPGLQFLDDFSFANFRGSISGNTLTIDGANTVTISINSPAVVTFNNHGLPNGTPFTFATTGTLPNDLATGLPLSGTYYVSVTNLLTNSFEFSSFAGGPVINTTGSQSGVQSVTVTTVGALDAGGSGIPPQILYIPGLVIPTAASNVTIVSGSGSTWTLSGPSLGTISSRLMQTAQYPWQGTTFGDIYSRLDRVTCELKEIASIVGNTITFTSPLTISYRTANTAQLTWYDNSGVYQPHTQGCGVEKLSFLGGDGGGVSFSWAAYCWAKNIENSIWNNLGLEFNAAFRCELRAFYSHDAAFPRPTSGAYAIALDQASSEILIENGISIRTNKAVVARAAGAGSVFAHNYTDMTMIDYNETWVEVGINGSHLVGPHHMLFEGNYATNIDSDDTHGASIYHTFFRNSLRGVRSTFTNPYDNVVINDFAAGTGVGSHGPQRCIGLQSYSYWMTCIGNVLGASGQMSGWNTITTTWGSPNIWTPGWDNDENGVASSDPNVLSTMIRWGNWDWRDSQQFWYNTQPVVLPNSLYLTTAPAFFGGNTWPWVDPTTGTALTLPAKLRFTNGTPNVVPNDT